MEQKEPHESIYELKKRENEIERHFQWRKETYSKAIEDGVDPKKAYLYANICANIVLMGVEYDAALMQEAMKYCPPAFKAEIDRLQMLQQKYTKQTVHDINAKK